MHEVLIASSILAITISGFTSGIIRSNQITHQASLRKAAESAITDDLESTVKHRFYTFRCRQGPCKAATAENDKSLMYYNREDSDDKQDFMERCNARDLAKELLSEDENGVTTGEKAIPSSLLADRNITITRRISLDDSNDNQAMIEYDAEKDNKVIATLKTTLVPNAVHWCH
ncbi:hypothetical protein [Synechococcus sp. MIT S9220]|uniref:type IV pilus modification PilV family protein n=1 Tax=Synechococcus sp. MIT S9220 TaxID=166309 RepID=UPI00164CB53F|nr:hypothetical protein [Synechococcus sp. MIT S9220]